jgi:hypothetical protein
MACNPSHTWFLSQAKQLHLPLNSAFMKYLSLAIVLIYSIQQVSAQEKKSTEQPTFVTSVEGVKEYRLE